MTGGQVTLCRLRGALALFLLAAFSFSCARFSDEVRNEDGGGPLLIFGTVDRANFEPILQGFLKEQPAITVTYVEMNSADIEKHVRERRSPYPDVILSSAMDRQMKLANDGYAAAHTGAVGDRIPGWAKWRQEVFAYAGEPIVMVFSAEGIRNRTAPRSRDQLYDALLSDPEFWHGRIATYDICESATGYLLISHDDRQAGEFTAVVGAMEASGVRTEGTSVELLNRIADGTYVMGYNLLESYVRAHPRNEDFVVVYPEDYTLVLLRTALINNRAPNPEQAGIFLDYLLSTDGETVIRDEAGIWPIGLIQHQPGEGFAEFPGLVAARPIPLTPGLIVYLDDRKRSHMLKRFAALCMHGAGSSGASSQ